MEAQVTLHGLQGRLERSDVQRLDGRRNPKCFTTQRIMLRRDISPSKYIRVELRFDDTCGNGHQDFAITGELWDTTESRREPVTCGCIHEEIQKHCPELAYLIKWHLCSTDGPMHYPGNVLYHAGERDCWGKLKGEPRSFETVIRFGKNPICHRFDRHPKFVQFLLDSSKAYDFEVIGIEHENREGETYKFSPKYTFGGYASKWHECPFDSEAEALAFLQALKTCKPEFHTLPVSWGEGKARELDHARSAAVWPEATDEDLSQPREALEAALKARLPKLLREFRRDMKALGFLWEVQR
jgi:hypothetical protein